MNVQPVRPKPSRLDRYLGLVTAFIAGALVVAIVKPWGSADTGGPPAAQLSTASPPASPTPPPAIGYEGRAYDPSIFGAHEPEATWAIWPAGFLVTFGFVIQVPGVPGPDSVPSAGPGSTSPAPSGLQTPPEPPAPSAAGGPGSSGIETDGPVWPARFDVPNGNHLLLIGINMPLGHSLSVVRLEVASATGSRQTLLIHEFPSPWPSHFAVIGMPAAANDNRLLVWPPGRYQLDMTFDPGGVKRSIEIDIVSSDGGS